MLKGIITLLSATALVATTNLVYATELKIGAGSQTGEYTNTIVPAIGNALTEHGYSAVAVESAGSLENIENVKAGSITAGLAQLDAVALSMTEEGGENLAVLGGKIAPEALFCAAKKISYADLVDSVREEELKVSVGPAKSGTSVTFQYMMALDKDIHKVKLVNDASTKLAINLLLSGGRDLVCFVMSPNPENELIKLVTDNKELNFIEIDRPVFATAKVGDMNVYGIMEVPVSGGFLGFSLKTEKVKTLVTWVGLVVNTTTTDAGALDALAQVTLKEDLLPDDSLAGKANNMMQGFTALFK